VGKSPLALLCLTAVGVVYGDIGTSPLYAIRECFFGPHGVPVTSSNVLGVLSLIFWSLIGVVTLKYHVYVLRADNRGEGGILALMSLVRGFNGGGRREALLVGLGLFGAGVALRRRRAHAGHLGSRRHRRSGGGDRLCCSRSSFPSRSSSSSRSLSSSVAAPRAWASSSAPSFLVWFATLALLGVVNIGEDPSVLSAVHPAYGIEFLRQNVISGYLVLGAVFLVATGGEALYADLGHFGERPIQIDWFAIVGPSLLLNYFGQGALLLHDPEAAHNPFYRMAPTWALYPLVVLATLATVIASQAVISGVFSLTRQAVQLGFAPRVEIVHTSPLEIGQIYIPAANWGLMVGTLALVLLFQSSSNLAAAYGVAVTTTMIITTLLAHVVARKLWGWRLPLALAVTGGFLVADLAFFGANIVKITHGGWF
jgi:KUP system potassium uptake protein